MRSPVGWHILLVDRVEPGRTPDFAETRAKIREDLAREQAIDAIVKLANQVEDTLAGGATLEEAAGQVNARLLRFRSVEPSGRSVDGDPKDGLLVLRRFLEAAFETNATEVSDLVETSLGGYFLVRVDRVVPPALEPFDKVRKEVAAAWRFDRLNEAARKRAEKLLSEVKSGRGFDTAAREFGLKIKTSSAFTRFDQGGEIPLPSSLAAALFGAKQGEAALGATGAGYAVAVLDRVEPANPSADNEGSIGFETRSRPRWGPTCCPNTPWPCARFIRCRSIRALSNACSTRARSAPETGCDRERIAATGRGHSYDTILRIINKELFFLFFSR